MATTVVQQRHDDGYETVEWASLAINETGDAGNVGRIGGIKTLQLSGTFSGQTVNVQGSMDGTTWATLHALDYDTGDYLALGAVSTAMLSAIVENPRYMRGIVSNGGTPAIKMVVGGYSRL